MTSKRRSAGDKRARKVQQRRQRNAEQAVSREQHAALVLGRLGDASFVQQRTNADGGRTLSWNSDTVGGAELDDAIDQQRQVFRDTFGRDPGPDDPLFFEPGSETPQEVSEETVLADVDSLIDKARAAGENPAYFQAWRDTGFLLTEHNMHLFSAADIDAWNDALERHWDTAAFGPFDVDES